MSIILRHGILEQEILEAAAPGGMPSDFDWHWSFENQDTTDDSGDGYDGCFYSATERNKAFYPTGIVGSFCFDPSAVNQSDRTGLVPAQHTGNPVKANITSKYAIATPDTFTLCFKYKADTSATWRMYLMAVQPTGGGTPYLRVFHETDEKIQLDIKNGSGKISDKGSTTINNDTWYSIIITYDGSGNGKVYLDGSEECSIAYGSDVNLGGNQITLVNLGENWFSGATKGPFDGVYFYARVLTSGERATFDAL